MVDLLPTLNSPWPFAQSNPVWIHAGWKYIFFTQLSRSAFVVVVVVVVVV